jgi:glutathione synthase/RimK-type ligase-like ATP-grasp enzyme
MLVQKHLLYRPQVRSRHPTHQPLRELLPKLPFKSIIRLGSTTESDQRIEINTPLAVSVSSNKVFMKEAFDEFNQEEGLGIPTSEWEYGEDYKEHNLRFPIVVKRDISSRGKGIYKINTQEELNKFFETHDYNKYMFEEFHDYSREYRLHITKDGCFYTCRKLLKEETPEDKRWFRNDSNSVWILEDNPKFDKPINWDSIVEASVNSINAVGLDIGAVDVRVQSAKNKKGILRENPKFVILETNSAPSHGKITSEKYLEVIPKLLTDKYNLWLNNRQ